ncbi:MAG TPA: hypothetical protein VNO21_15980, partial [Polyangiaceae bacterium]|nr:hypothetical protein [Polyangiaceae bacterium]
MNKSRVGKWAPCAMTIGTLVACSSSPSDPPPQSNPPVGTQTPGTDDALAGRAAVTLGTQGWQVLSSAIATQSGVQISSPDFSTQGWLPVKPDDAGAPGTEINALVQNGQCADVFFSDNMRKCFGYVTTRGPVTVKQFAVPWWFRTDFTPQFAQGQHAKLIIGGVVGEADVWVNGKQVATRDTVSGAFSGHTFDVSALVHAGKNSLAIKMYPNDPSKMFTVDNVDWAQIPPDNQTGIQYPIQLQISDALSGSNAHVVQKNAPDLSSSALTVKVDVTNDSAQTQQGTVTATVTPPAGGSPIVVQQTVSVAAHATTTVSFSSDKFASLNIAHPQVWWPYLFGAQPLYTLTTEVAQNGKVSTSASDTFGIRTVTSRLVGKSSAAPQGARIFAINGKEFVFR